MAIKIGWQAFSIIVDNSGYVMQKIVCNGCKTQCEKKIEYNSNYPPDCRKLLKPVDLKLVAA